MRTRAEIAFCLPCSRDVKCAAEFIFINMACTKFIYGSLKNF